MLKGKRVLVVRNDRIGDLVLALPLIEALADAGATVGVLASRYTAPLLEKDARVSEVLAPDNGNELAAIRARPWDCALCLWATTKNAWMLYRSGIPERLGPGSRPFSLLFTRRLPLRRGQGLRHESELNFEFARDLGADARVQAPRLRLASEDMRQARSWLKRQARGLGSKGPLVFLHPGSKGSALNWQPARYAALGLAMRQRFKARLLVSGGPGDEQAVQDLGRALGKTALCMREALPLRAFVALLGQADLFVSASTGPMHLAAAMGTPTLSFFPPQRAMSALRWGPRGNRHAVLSPAGLGWRVPPARGAGTLERISVDEAVQAAATLLT